MNIRTIMTLERRMRALAPVVHSITNQVVMNFTANVLLAAGASPIMAHALEEIEDVGALSSALVLNIGTADQGQLRAMRRALDVALGHGIPIALDPVGAGATAFRTAAARELAEAAASGRRLVIRGNASEIMALAGAKCTTRGVESSRSSEDSIESAAELAERYHAVIAVSGAEDLVTDGTRLFVLHGGDFLMTRVTGMGCSATALVAAFCAAAVSLPVDLLNCSDCPDLSGKLGKNGAPVFSESKIEMGHVFQPGNMLAGATAAMAIMSAAGRAAAQGSIGPGSFVSCFLDMLYEELALEAALNTHVRVAECCVLTGGLSAV